MIAAQTLEKRTAEHKDAIEALKAENAALKSRLDIPGKNILAKEVLAQLNKEGSMKRLLSVLGLVVVIVTPVQVQATPLASDLFFSEYIEGTGNNKALEIFNGTGAPIDLAAGGYNMLMYFNGSPSAGLTIDLTGTVADGDVYVVAQASAGSAILAQADLTSGASWFNGDDAVSLRIGTTVIDVIGQIGFDPGTEWGTGLTSTADNTLRRKASILAGDSNGSDAFDPSLEWDGFSTDTFDGLGSHTIAISVVPEPATIFLLGSGLAGMALMRRKFKK